MKYDGYKQIEGYPSYAVSETGIVVNTKRSSALSQSRDGSGYYSVSLFRNGKGKTYRIHRIVAMAFIPKPAGKDFVNHINGIKLDNKVSNLEWCTRNENAIHASRIGLMASGMRNRQTKVTEAIGRKISEMKNAGISFKEISKKLSIDRKTAAKHYHQTPEPAPL